MRKKLFLYNTGSALLKQIVYVICGLMLPRYNLLCFGSSVNGLVSPITRFWGFILYLEMGIRPVIQSNLYRPLANKHEVEGHNIFRYLFVHERSERNGINYEK